MGLDSQFCTEFCTEVQSCRWNDFTWATRSIGQMVKRLVNAALRTMRVADVHRYQTTTFSLFDNLDMRQRAGDNLTSLPGVSRLPNTKRAGGPSGLHRR
jgi:hypothetical protein